jgi:aerobic carbon-monoxide dehydrogenase large subunit
MPYALAKVEELDLSTATDTGDYRKTFEHCLAEIGWAAKASLQGKAIDGRYHGLAVGCYFEGGASGPREHARLVLERDGTVCVHVGSSANGQGLETAFAQIAADALEIPLSRIRGVLHGSTDLLPEGFGTYSSRSIVMGGSAILAAAAKLREMIRVKAARPLDSDTRDVEMVADGAFASPHRTYSYGAHAAHVAVDPATGHVEVLHYVAVEDVGRIINPAMLHGQTIGAIVQGLGGTLLEHLVYDEQGQLLTGSLADYLMPAADNFPAVRAIAFEEKPAPHNPLGAKGAGEGGIIPVGGVIANAVAAALRPFGAEPRELPLSPPKVWEMIARARRR